MPLRPHIGLERLGTSASSVTSTALGAAWLAVRIGLLLSWEGAAHRPILVRAKVGGTILSGGIALTGPLRIALQRLAQQLFQQRLLIVVQYILDHQVGPETHVIDKLRCFVRITLLMQEMEGPESKAKFQKGDLFHLLLGQVKLLCNLGIEQQHGQAVGCGLGLAEQFQQPFQLGLAEYIGGR